MGSVNLDNTGSGSAITLSSDGTSLLLNGTAIGGGGSPDLFAENYDGTSTAPSATGPNAIALGYGSVASGSRSLVLLQNGTASGNRALSAGFNSTASGSNSVAFGSSAVASGVSSYALGSSTDSTHLYSVALGYSSQAVADYSIALGRSYVSGQEGFAAQIGNNTSSYGASGVNSIAMGYLADADYRSVAIGYNVGGSGSYGISLGSDSGVGIYASSAAIGRNVQSTASNQVSIGGSTQDVRISETYTLPRVDGSANQVLTTDGSGAVSWATAGGATDINGLSDAVSNTWKSLALGADAGASLVSGTHGYNSGEYNTLVGQLAGY